MLLCFALLSLFAPAAACASAHTQPPHPAQHQQRDLKIEKIETSRRLRPKRDIPRSYAVIVGISRYPKLPGSWQLNSGARRAIHLHRADQSGRRQFQAGKRPRADRRQGDAGASARRSTSGCPRWQRGRPRGDLLRRPRLRLRRQGLSGALRFRSRQRRRHRLSHGRTGRGDRREDPRKWKILLTDACHSGAISPEETRELEPSWRSLTSRSFRSPPAATARAPSRVPNWKAATASSLTMW